MKAQGKKGIILSGQYLLTVLLALVFITLSACGGSVGGEGQTQDPVVQDLPVIYIKRSIIDEDGFIGGDDIRRPTQFNGGAQLFVKSQASPSAIPNNLSELLFSSADFADDEGNVLYDAKHLSPSFDGNRVLFSAHAPEVDDDEQITWNIYEYNVVDNTIIRLITSDIVAEDGDDLFPAYLPDGRVVFSSTRQRQSKALLLDEGKPQFSALDENRRDEALSLHVMSSMGEDIEQISFNQSNDTNPVVLNDGRLAFIRWDNAGSNNEFNLYTVNPDGTRLQLLYGNNSHATGTDDNNVHYDYLRLTEEDGLVLVARQFAHEQWGGDLFQINFNDYVDAQRRITGEESDALLGQISLSNSEVITTDGLSPSGRYHSVNPLWDGTGRYLVSWTSCRLTNVADESEEVMEAPQLLPCTQDEQDSGLVQSDPLYGLWILDVEKNSQLPIERPQEGVAYTEGVIIQSRALPTNYSASATPDPDLVAENLGVVSINSVYDWDGVDITPNGIESMADPMLTPPLNRPVQFIRIEKAVSIPDDDVLDFDNTAFGFSGSQLMREIIGYVPVEPDGSASFKVPADIGFALSLTDHLGRRLGARHQNWLQLRAGETLSCNGCHERNSGITHGRLDATPQKVYSGANTTGLPFPNTLPELFADMGETMAGVYSRINGPRSPDVSLIYVDEWSDPALVNLAESYTRQYQDLETQVPTSNACVEEWEPLCRIVINYEENIQPLWDLDRKTIDADGVTVLNDNTCVSCHSSSDSEGLDQVPAAQLQLENQPSTDEPDHLLSYRELLRNDFEQELVDGILIDREELVFDTNGDPVFLVDDEGELLLDAEGNPIQQTQRFTVSPSMTPSGALASEQFFDLFTNGGSHDGRLSDAELRLVAEWLDIGAQYYNNPFKSVED